MLKKPKRPHNLSARACIKRMGLGAYGHIASLRSTRKRDRMKKYHQELEAYNKQQEALAEKQSKEIQE